MSSILERVNTTLDALSDLAGTGIAANRLEARVELLYLVGDVLHYERENIKRRILEDIAIKTKRNYRQASSVDLLIERLRKGGKA